MTVNNIFGKGLVGKLLVLLRLTILLDRLRLPVNIMIVDMVNFYFRIAVVLE